MNFNVQTFKLVGSSALVLTEFDNSFVFETSFGRLIGTTVLSTRNELEFELALRAIPLKKQKEMSKIRFFESNTYF